MILMDIKIPKMDGYKAAKLLRKNGFKSPIIAMSASQLTTDYKKCGFDKFLPKPVDGNKLYEVITQLI
jgi:CheY-like chemotaxis protein